MAKSRDRMDTIKLFVSFLGVAAILPVMLFAVVFPGRYNFLSQADSPTELRLWFEPSTVVVKPGQSFKFKVMADYSDPTRLIPEVNVGVEATAGLKVNPGKVVYQNAFAGRVQVGEVEVVAPTAGEYTIEMPQSGVFTKLVDLPIVTGKAKVVVR